MHLHRLKINKSVDIDMNFDKIRKNLYDIGFTSRVFEKRGDACDYLLKEIKNTSVGIGGSVTVRELDIYERLKQNNTVYWHWYKDESKTTEEMLRLASNTDVYISSVNAIAETGEIVNIDGTCNRIASISYGHKKVYLIIGKNKITKDLDSAISRARNVAAPLNARRLGKNTPCAKGELKCYNCKSSDKICRNLSVIWKAPEACLYDIIFINEDLGY